MGIYVIKKFPTRIKKFAKYLCTSWLSSHKPLRYNTMIWLVAGSLENSFYQASIYYHLRGLEHTIKKSIAIFNYFEIPTPMFTQFSI